MKDWETDGSLLQTYDVVDFLKLDIPPRRRLLAPWLESASLNMVYAKRGVGKTHFAMHLAHALATGGSFLGWQALEPVPVLYIDGEMPAAAMQDRWRPIMQLGGEPRAGMLRILPRDAQDLSDIPNMASSAGLDEVSKVFGDAKLVILDNVSSLAYGVKENEADGWDPIAQWAIQQRAKGRSLLLVHHAGKNGGQRGTSKREDLMDVVIKLQHPESYRPEDGARFEVHFDKARSLYGPDVAPFEAQLLADGNWKIGSAGGVDARMRELQAQGLSMRQIADEIGCNASTVSRRLREA